MDMVKEVGFKMVINILILAIIAGLTIVGLVVKTSGEEIDSKVYNYNGYECTKVMALDKYHVVYKIGDAEKNKAYLYITGEGTLYDAGSLVK